MDQSEGVIIRLTKLTETSLIVHWCTKDHGVIKTVAKGARRAKSPFAGKLDLFYSAEFSWTRSRKSELHTLREVVISDYREGLRLKYANTLMAAYFTELLSHVTELEFPVPELYDLLLRGLGYLDDQGADERALLHYEKEMARLLGVASQKMSAKMSIEQAFGNLPRSVLASDKDQPRR